MEFQREPGRIYAEEEGRVIAEVTFPDRDGAADIDQGKRARATCSYAEIWFERHPEEADLLCP